LLSFDFHTEGVALAFCLAVAEFLVVTVTELTTFIYVTSDKIRVVPYGFQLSDKNKVLYVAFRCFTQTKEILKTVCCFNTSLTVFITEVKQSNKNIFF
jgi:hypothetical protein